MPKYNVVVENKMRYVVQASGEDLRDAFENYLNGDCEEAEAEAKADVTKHSESSDVVMVYKLMDGEPV